MREHWLCLKQPGICTLLISSLCQSLSNPPNRYFPPWSSISLLGIEFLRWQRWLSSLPIKASPGTGRSGTKCSQDRWAGLGMGNVGMQLQGAALCSSLTSGPQGCFWPQEAAQLPGHVQEQTCRQPNDFSAWNVRLCGSVLCRHRTRDPCG